MMRSPKLPPPEVWDQMTGDQQLSFMRQSALVAEYHRQLFLEVQIWLIAAIVVGAAAASFLAVYMAMS